ncbi:MAG: hypothetical protein RIK87_10015 [Fuerstiella sp.]
MISHPATPPINGQVLYLAFRAAYLSTFESLKAELAGEHSPRHGFLDHIPLATGCAPQVQLDCLLTTWHRISTAESRELSAVEQCVCYCAANELAKLGEAENRRLIRQAADGPAAVTEVDCLWLASKIRSLQLTLPVRFGSLNALRDGHLLTTALDNTGTEKINSQTVEELLQVVGAWQVSPKILSHAAGLLNDRERRELGSLLQKHPRLMNL